MSWMPISVAQLVDYLVSFRTVRVRVLPESAFFSIKFRSCVYLKITYHSSYSLKAFTEFRLYYASMNVTYINKQQKFLFYYVVKTNIDFVHLSQMYQSAERRQSFQCIKLQRNLGIKQKTMLTVTLSIKSSSFPGDSMWQSTFRDYGYLANTDPYRTPNIIIVFAALQIHYILF